MRKFFFLSFFVDTNHCWVGWEPPQLNTISSYWDYIDFFLCLLLLCGYCCCWCCRFFFADIKKISSSMLKFHLSIYLSQHILVNYLIVLVCLVAEQSDQCVYPTFSFFLSLRRLKTCMYILFSAFIVCYFRRKNKNENRGECTRRHTHTHKIMSWSRCLWV